jgi:hypothetical protein
MHPRKVCLARVSRFLALALSMLMVLTGTPVLVLPTFASSFTSLSAERPPLEFVLSEVDNPGKKEKALDLWLPGHYQKVEQRQY